MICCEVAFSYVTWVRVDVFFSSIDCCRPLLQSVVVDTRVIIVAWQLACSHTSFSLSISEWLSTSQVSLQHARKPFAHVPSLLESLQQTLSSKPQDFCHILNCESCLISAFPVAESLVLLLKQLWRNISFWGELFL